MKPVLAFVAVMVPRVLPVFDREHGVHEGRPHRRAFGQRSVRTEHGHQHLRVHSVVRRQRSEFEFALAHEGPTSTAGTVFKYK